MATNQNFQILLKKFLGKLGIKLSLICLIISLGSCSSRDSTTSVSASDNKSFNTKGYKKQEPIRPFGNIPDLKTEESQSVEYYDNYIANRYNSFEENERYMQWLANQRKIRLEKGKRNDFKAETLPSHNNYYIQKSQKMKNDNISITERRVKDIEIKLNERNKKNTAVKKIETIDEINNYSIIGSVPDSDTSLPVERSDY